MSSLSNPSAFILMIGPLHPLVVHLPIGFLILAAVFYVLGRKEAYNFLHKALPICLLLTALSAIIASILGWILAEEQAYSESDLFLHRWMGIALSIGSSLAWLWSIGRLGGSPKRMAALLFLLLPLLFATGHYGGSLTHGRGYLLKAAPSAIQRLFGWEKTSTEALTFPAEPDSVLFYTHLIQPMLDQKCVRCHGENKVTGGLRMDSKAALLKGGLNGPILIAGQAAESELFHRVTLPGTSRKYMPPNGPRLSYREIRLLDYWIKSGASFDLAISDEKIPKDIQQLLLSQYGLTTKKRPIYERITLSQVEEALLAQVNAAGFKASPIAAANPFLSIRSQGKITAEQMKILQGIKHHITWLDLSNSQIEDEALKSLSAFPHLTRLKLNNNPISDQGIAQLQDLPELTSLNLYGTQVGDASLALLAEWSSLKKLFLWQSKVSQEGVEQFKSARPDVAVEVGLDLAL